MHAEGLHLPKGPRCRWPRSLRHSARGKTFDFINLTSEVGATAAIIRSAAHGKFGAVAINVACVCASEPIMTPLA